MSYPVSIDEVEEDKLIAELERRKKLRAEGRCDYCGQRKQTPKCRFPDRHKQKAAQS